MIEVQNSNITNISNLRLIREQKKITQLKLSVDLEVSQESISQYECGTSLPSVVNLVKLAEYFNCSTDYLLGRTDVIKPVKSINKNEIKISNIVTAYENLPKIKRDMFDCYLKFLTQPESDV